MGLGEDAQNGVAHGPEVTLAAAFAEGASVGAVRQWMPIDWRALMKASFFTSESWSVMQVSRQPQMVSQVR